MGGVAARARGLVGICGLALVAAGCQPEVFVSVRRPVPPAGAIVPRTASIQLASFADARPDAERALLGRSAEKNLLGGYPRILRTADDVARVTTEAVRDDLERNGFAVLPAERDSTDVVLSGSVTRAWIDIRRSWGITCAATLAADVEVRGPGGMVHTYVVGQSEWTSALESPKPKDYEDVFQRALADLTTKVSAFVRQSVRAPAAPAAP